MSEEEMFFHGVEAMRSRIVAFLVTKGRMDMAQQVIVLDAPKFQLPERFTLRKEPPAEEQS
jgi:hypothetical protein